MINFNNDYNDIAHVQILEKFVEVAKDSHASYGNDAYSTQAKSMLQNILQADIDLYFIHGGTMANIVALTSLLKPYEAIIASKNAHIYRNETGAIEARGHRIIPVDTKTAKLSADDIHLVMSEHSTFFNVLPKIVCISNTSEFGEVYKANELQELYQTCKKYGLTLYMDGARLGSAMNSDVVDYSWNELQQYCDIASIGGTKNGGLFGEALVFFDKRLSQNFKYYQKNQGALLAKTYLIALQFVVFFEDNLYNENAALANQMAHLLSEQMDSSLLLFPVESNQIFIPYSEKLEDVLHMYEIIAETPSIHLHGKVFRFVTSYRTTTKDIDNLVLAIKEATVR